MATDTGTRRTRATEGTAPPVRDPEAFIRDLKALCQEHTVTIRTLTTKQDFEKRQTAMDVKFAPYKMDVQGELFDGDSDDE